jgi:uncharacterized protein YceH (UPF0502 family)
MTDQDFSSPETAAEPPRWQPLGVIDRRVVGVLAEKAKTTPDAYPMSLNAIRNGCNQKSNRFPPMDLQAEDVEESLERLRDLGAVGMIEGHGRVPKYRHYLYEWLAVEKVELAVMTELLLRGPQTEGALRARAARMEPIRDLGELRPVLTSLKAKGLVIALTPEGRGHVVTHGLHQPQELEELRAQYGRGVASHGPAAVGLPGATAAAAVPAPQPSAAALAAAAVGAEALEDLRRQLAELRSQVVQLQSELEGLSQRQDQTEEQLRDLGAMGG